MIESYSSIFNLGHRAVSTLLDGPVIVEEKVDGSQFSFSLGLDGELRCRSKGSPLNLLAPEKMFKRGVEVVQQLHAENRLKPGWIYRGEYLNTPKHNVLAYDRVPKNHIIIFDILHDTGEYLQPYEKVLEAEWLRLECVPSFVSGGTIGGPDFLRDLLDKTSILGGQKIEGVVVKPACYGLYGPDKKVLMAKFVSESFKEVHAHVWKQEHATKGPNEIIGLLSAKYGTQARWQKALIHLKEQGVINNAPQDIPHLLKEIPEDILKECEAEIREQLFEWAWPQLRRSVTRGMPEWYREEINKSLATVTAE